MAETNAIHPKPLQFNSTFVWLMGVFHARWSTLDLLLSFSIGQFLNISDDETHILTTGMEFGRKASLLRNLAHRSVHLNRLRIITAIGRLQNESKRNLFSHGYWVSDSRSITFIDRTRGGDFKVSAVTFTLNEFSDHVVKFSEHLHDLDEALGYSEERVRNFALSALDQAQR